MTNHWIDIKNSDVILIMGSNAAENHPVSFRWVTKALENGATLISVDPRFTRTSAKADIYAPIRAGTDIAFLGGLIKYILDNNLYHRAYIVEHTNAPFLVNPDFSFEEGLFCGYIADKRKYDKSAWTYQIDAAGIPLEDPSLQDPNSVFQLLKQHYAPYDISTVSQITGTPPEDLGKIYEAFAATGEADKVATIMYAMGWTQHTYGTQNIRAAAIIQLLLGNVGRAGGGINALRGESNVQGSTDHCLLFHILPGYLKPPQAKDETLEAYLAAYTPSSSDPKSANWWQHYPKYAVSLFKWMYGHNATPENEFGYQWLPKLADGSNYSWLSMFEAMYAGDIKGFFAWGQNPAVGGANANMNRKAMENLDWMVAVNLWDTETSSFWQRPGVDPADIKTEVFLLPVAASVEKEGSITNSGRWGQWRWKAVDPPGEAKADSWLVNQMMIRLRALYEANPGPNPDPILKLAWNYGSGEVNPHQVAKEVNGWAVSEVKDADGNVIVPSGKQVKNFTQLRDDGSTACANWLYSGSYNEEGNMMARRDNIDTHPAGIGLYSNWAWAWPVNRRIIYNRASCNAEGQPFDPNRFVVRWNGEKWEGDVPDGGWPPEAKHAFIMKPEGHARIFGAGRADGPFPTHYEPWESPVDNLLYPDQQISPAFKIWDSEMDRKGGPFDYPLVGTTYRVSEHWQSGAMTRNQPWLAEMQPNMFVEMSPELAAERSIQNGEKIIVESARGSIEAIAMVTRRIRPLQVNGQIVHQVGLPWHWGYKGLVTGGSANELTPPVGDANTMIPETKAFLCNVKKIEKGGEANV
jgi:formate dehydrogenase major subunit